MILFVAGLFILAHETMLASEPRPTIVVASMALLGVPFVMAADERRRKSSHDSDERSNEDPA